MFRAAVLLMAVLYAAKPSRAYQTEVGPVYEGVSYDMKKQQHRIGVKNDLVRQLSVDNGINKHHTTLMWPAESISGGPFSAFVVNRTQYRADDVKSIRENFKMNPDLYSKKELCNKWVFNALDEMDAHKTFVGYTETGLCIHEPTSSTATLKSICPLHKDANVYRIVSIARLAHNDNASMLMFDEAGLSIPFKVLGDDGSCPAYANLLKDPFQIGGFTLDARNRQFNYSIDYLVQDGTINDWVTHFEHSMIESVTYFRSNLYYSRGFRLLGGERLIKFAGKDGAKYVPPKLLEMDQINFNVQAMELYAHGATLGNETIYFHAAGVQYIDGKTGLKPYYLTCQLKNGETHQSGTSAGLNGTFPSGSSRCSSKSLNDYVMPVDFVYYNTTNCKKLLMFFQYAVRIFEPTDDLATAGLDYAKSPFNVLDWMNFHLKAVLHHRGRFYYFAAANRVFIQPARMEGGCADILTDPGPLEEHFASELIIRSLMDLGVSTGAAAAIPKYQYDPYRIGEPITGPSVFAGQLERLNLSKFQWNPPLDYRKDIPSYFLLGSTVEPPRGFRLNLMSFLTVLVWFAIITVIIYCCFCGSTNRDHEGQDSALTHVLSPTDKVEPTTDTAKDIVPHKTVASAPSGLVSNKSATSRASWTSNRTEASKSFRTLKLSATDHKSPDAKVGKSKSKTKTKRKSKASKSKTKSRKSKASKSTSVGKK